ncbi:MAG: peptidase C15 [Limnothrix sp.]
MTRRKILLTSFRPWLAHHHSNSSDDLLGQIQAIAFPKHELMFLRHLPVETEAASQKTIQAIATQKPDAVICCGMAESRTKLTVEAQAFAQAKHYETTVNLSTLTQQLKFTKISHDAGKFVCEGLYFSVLEHIHQQQLKIAAIFLHIPLLTDENNQLIMQDFRQIIHALTSS